MAYSIIGKAYWAKILGEPGPAFDDGKFEWSIDVTLSPESKAFLEGLGLGPKVLNKGDERGDYITFRRSQLKKAGPKQGQPNPPIRVAGKNGEEWDPETKIGNGSKVSVDFNTYDSEYKKKKFKGVSILEVEVLDLVPYTAPVREAVAAGSSSTGGETWVVE